MIEGIFEQQTYTLAKQVMDASAVRHAALTRNVANLETPGYRRVDLAAGFETALAEAARKGDARALGNLRPEIETDPAEGAMRADGNNVELDHELLAINQNALTYEFAAQFVSDSVKSLRTAITGRPY